MTPALTPATSVETIRGLSEAEAQALLDTNGFNELPVEKEKNIFKLLFNVLKEPMFLLLLVSGIIYFFVGELKDALTMLTFVMVVIFITLYQEAKTEHTMQALKDLSSPRAIVIRDGEQKRVSGKYVVVGDVMVLSEGERVPADAVVLAETNLLINESLLTGESLAVHKSVWDGRSKLTQPGGDNLPYIYSGTLIEQGRGIAQVIKTGSDTEMGKIGKELLAIEDEDSLLKKETTRIVKIIAILSVVLSLLVALIYILVRDSLIQGLLAGLTLSMSLIPEEIPMILTVFLTIGAWRISKQNVLTRRNTAIETLGASNILCVDKTGTLTENKMELSEIVIDEEAHEINLQLPQNYRDLLNTALLASQEHPTDPIEKEILRVGKSLMLLAQTHLHLVKEYPLEGRIRAISNIWRDDSGVHTVSCKGAPETLIELCHLDVSKSESIMRKIHDMADEGLRVIAVAKANYPKITSVVAGDFPEEQHDFNFEFLGLLGFSDPVRLSVPNSITECYRAGIRVCMITGDYPGTAQHVANKIGLKNPENYITGEELSNLPEADLLKKMEITNIFARVLPEHKLKIVNLFKKYNNVVAMTGDGVNDAPALKAANIGVAMGERGTDVAREAADLVVLNDNFSSIVGAVRLGRRIYDNLVKAMSYTISAHIPIAGMSILPLIFNWPSMLFPAHVAFLELIIDPACSIVFESEKAEHNVMNRPPRAIKQHLFNPKTLGLSLVQGTAILITVALTFIVFLNFGKPEATVRAMAFTTLIVSNIFLIITNLSHDKPIWEILRSGNKALYLISGGALLLLVAELNIPFFTGLLNFNPLTFREFFISALLGVLSIIWYEAIKVFGKHYKQIHTI